MISPYAFEILRALAVEVVLVPQQHEPFPLEVFRRVLVELAGHAPSHAVEPLVHHLHEMEPVVDDLRLGDRLLRPRGVGLRHVHADVADLRPGAPDARREHLQRVGPLASRNAQHVARLRVADDGDELSRRPSPVENLHFVHGYPPDLPEGDVPVLVREEALLHVLDGVPRDVEVLGYALYGHLRAELQDQLLQGLRDPGLGRREERERLVERLLAAMAPALVHAEPEERQQLPVGKPLHVPLPAGAGQQNLRAAVGALERLAHERHDLAPLPEPVLADIQVISVPQEALDVADPADFRLSGLKSPDGLAILQLVNSLHLSFLSCLAAETERICKSAPEIKGLGDPRLWFQALLLTNNREEPLRL